MFWYMEVQWKHPCAAYLTGSCAMDQIANFPSTGQKVAEQSKHLSATGQARLDDRDLNRSGAVGDPRLATAELGQEILTRAAKGIAELLEDLDKVDL